MKIKKMKILAIDTSSDYLSVAVMEGAGVLAGFHKYARTNHSRLLVPTISKLLKTSRLKLKDLDGFAVSAGPGSFTGLRIGVTTVKTLALCLKKPVVTVPTLDAIAENARNYGRDVSVKKGGPYKDICPVLDAKKGKVYACLYRVSGKKMKRLLKYKLIPIAELLNMLKGDIIFLGTGVEIYKDRIVERLPEARFFTGDDWRPKASTIGALGLRRLKKKDTADVDDITPFYIYSKECAIKGY